VHDQAALRQREAGEHPDGEQRDQRQHVPAHRDEQHAGGDGQRPDPGREHLPVIAQEEQVR
jgi:hypothetical protein